MMKSSARISSLDGLRGVAIVLVLLFHAYARWPDYIPWATVNKNFPLFKLGYLGVELFFLISGFVIYMTLEKCSTFYEFIYRRWLRLFPAMLIGTVLVYSTSEFFYERPAGNPKLIDILPGLLFVEPIVLSKLIGGVNSIEGAFWSLFVEVKFYFLLGILYFVSRSKALYMLAFLFYVRFLYSGMLRFEIINSSYYLEALFRLSSLEFFGWFCAGAFLYKSYIEKKKRYSMISAATVLPSIILIGGRQPDVLLACLVVYLIFCVGIFNSFALKILQSRLCQFFGFISYPLYLIHENAMVSMSIKTHRFLDGGGMLTPLPGLVFIVAASYIKLDGRSSPSHNSILN